MYIKHIITYCTHNDYAYIHSKMIHKYIELMINYNEQFTLTQYDKFDVGAEYTYIYV